MPLSSFMDESHDDNEFIGTILQRSKKVDAPSEEDEELRMAMQRAWALLEGKEEEEHEVLFTVSQGYY
jgi:hypothetical protein